MMKTSQPQNDVLRINETKVFRLRPCLVSKTFFIWRNVLNYKKSKVKFSGGLNFVARLLARSRLISHFTGWNISTESTTTVSKSNFLHFNSECKKAAENVLIIVHIPGCFGKLKLENIDITPLGHFTENQKKILVLKNGQEINMEAEGWNHF